MKIILKAHLKRQSDAEDKRKILIEKYSDRIQSVFKVKESVVPNIVDQIIDVSVTSTESNQEKGKPTYAEWIIQKFLQAGSGLTPRLINDKLEDGSKIVEFLKPFHQLKNDPNSRLKKDINQYRTFSDLAEAIMPLQEKKMERLETEQLKSLKQKVGKADLPGLKTLWHGKYKGDQYWIYRAEGTDLQTLDSLALLAGKIPYVCSKGKYCGRDCENQKWPETGVRYIEGQWYCSEDPDSFDPDDDRSRFKECTWCTHLRSTNYEYLQDGPITTIYKNGQPWAQTHPDSGQFMDKNDQSVNSNGSSVKQKDLYEVMSNVEDSTQELTTFVSDELSETLRNILKKRSKTARVGKR